MLIASLLVVLQGGLGPAEFTEITSGSTPTVVRFLSRHRRRSVELESDFGMFAARYANASGLAVGHVNCGKYRRLCLREGVWDTPVVRLYGDGVCTAEYDGGMSQDSLSAWVERHTGVAGAYMHEALRHPNNRTLHDLVNSTHCVFVMFHQPGIKRCRRFLPRMHDVAASFSEGDGVAVAEVDTAKFRSFHFDYKLRKYPAFVLFRGGAMLSYPGAANMYDIVDYINDHCGTTRSIGGGLHSDAGVHDEYSSIVEDFMRRLDGKYLRELEGYPDSGVYTSIMSRVLSDGTEFLHTELARVQQLLDGGAMAQEQRDSLAIRANVLRVFLEYL